MREEIVFISLDEPVDEGLLEGYHKAFRARWDEQMKMLKDGTVSDFPNSEELLSDNIEVDESLFVEAQRSFEKSLNSIMGNTVIGDVN